MVSVDYHMMTVLLEYINCLLQFSTNANIVINAYGFRQHHMIKLTICLYGITVFM